MEGTFGIFNGNCPFSYRRRPWWVNLAENEFAKAQVTFFGRTIGQMAPTECENGSSQSRQREVLRFLGHEWFLQEML